MSSVSELRYMLFEGCSTSVHQDPGLVKLV